MKLKTLRKTEKEKQRRHKLSLLGMKKETFLQILYRWNRKQFYANKFDTSYKRNSFLKITKQTYQKNRKSEQFPISFES